MMSVMDTSSPIVNRPGCITAYAILLWIGGGLYVIAALCGGLGGLYYAANPSQSSQAALTVPLLIGAVCIGLFALLPIFMGVGLWQMKNWAWWLVVILQSLGMASLLLNLCSLVLAAGSSSRSAGGLIGGIIGALIGGAINAGILYWFLKNHNLFTGGAGAPATSGGGGGAGVVAVVIIAVIGIVILVPVVIIVILALLGPAIGNVFSNIMLTL
jgi:hypothetical protein